MSTINITAHELDKQQLDAIKALLKALKIKFELSTEKSDKTTVSLTKGQKSILDKRRATSKEADFIPWNKAKKQLKFKSK